MKPTLIKRFHDLNMRWSLFEDFPYVCPGVTSVLDCISTAAMNEKRVEKKAEDWNAAKEKGANRGTALHAIFDDIMNGVVKDIPPEFSEDVAAFKNYIGELKIKPMYNEVSLYHPEYGFGGTADFIGEVDGKLEIWDFKTGSKYDIKTGWQMAAYKLMAEAHFGIKIEGMRGLHIKWGKCRPYTYQHLDFCRDKFLATFEAWKGLYWNYLMKAGIKDQEGGRKYLWDDKVMNCNGFLRELTKEVS